MHYKNGRPAQNGDKVMLIPAGGGAPVVGVLFDAVVGAANDYGSLAPLNGGYAPCCTNLKECLRLDDALEALKSAPAFVPVEPAAAPVAPTDETAKPA